jgi:glycerate dehydrogenase
VFSSEPMTRENPLLGAKNIYLTPHIAGKGKEGVQKSFDAAMNNLRLGIAGKTPNNLLNPEALRKSEPAR